MDIHEAFLEERDREKEIHQQYHKGEIDYKTWLTLLEENRERINYLLSLQAQKDF